MSLVVGLVVLVRGRVFRNSFPALTVVKLHPIVLSILNFSRILQRLRE